MIDHHQRSSKIMGTVGRTSHGWGSRAGRTDCLTHEHAVIHWQRSIITVGAIVMTSRGARSRIGEE